MSSHVPGDFAWPSGIYLRLLLVTCFPQGHPGSANGSSFLLTAQADNPGVSLDSWLSLFHIQPTCEYPLAQLHPSYPWLCPAPILQVALSTVTTAAASSVEIPPRVPEGLPQRRATVQTSVYRPE